MENRTNRLAKLTFRSLPAVILLVAAGVLFLDEPVALAVAVLLRSNRIIDDLAGGIPDLLLPFVLVLSAAMWAARFLRVRRGIRDTRAEFYRLAGLVLPLSFLAKTALKFLFGRVETRVWLKEPSAGLLWFRPGEGHLGFPSGHMAVFAALAAACWLCYPRLLVPCLLFLLFLGGGVGGPHHQVVRARGGVGSRGLAGAGGTAVSLERHAD
jgi:hypothetical protein